MSTPPITDARTKSAAYPLRVMARKPAIVSDHDGENPGAAEGREVAHHLLEPFGPDGIGEIAGRAQRHQQPLVERARAPFAHRIGKLGEGEQHGQRQ